MNRLNSPISTVASLWVFHLHPQINNWFSLLAAAADSFARTLLSLLTRGRQTPSDFFCAEAAENKMTKLSNVYPRQLNSFTVVKLQQTGFKTKQVEWQSRTQGPEGSKPPFVDKISSKSCSFQEIKGKPLFE